MLAQDPLGEAVEGGDGGQVGVGHRLLAATADLGVGGVGGVAFEADPDANLLPEPGCFFAFAPETHARTWVVDVLETLSLLSLEAMLKLEIPKIYDVGGVSRDNSTSQDEIKPALRHNAGTRSCESSGDTGYPFPSDSNCSSLFTTNALSKLFAATPCNIDSRRE